MTPGSDPSKSEYALALAHYESVGKEFAEYFKMYMQAWSIVGSAVVVGVIFGLRRGEGKGGILDDILLWTTPLLTPVWFLATSWFWAYFAMYREYLRSLETRMWTLQGSIGDIVSFHSYRNPWFDPVVQRPASYLACGLGGVAYFALAWAASWHLAGRVEWGGPWWVYPVFAWLAFVLIAVLSLWLAVRLSRRIPPVWSPSGGASPPPPGLLTRPAAAPAPAAAC